MNEENEVLLSPCTGQEDFESMKRDFISMINDLGGGDVSVTVTTEKEEDDYIACSTSIESTNSGYGNYYGGVRFVNPESIINFIVHCAGYTDIGSLGFGVRDLSDSEVEIELVKKSPVKH